MPLQKQVISGYPVGVPGMKATFNPFSYAGNRIVSGNSAVPVRAGGFVWRDTATGPESSEFGVVATGTAGVQPLGIVERVIGSYDPNIFSPGTLDISPGSNVDVIAFGDVFVSVVTETPAIGDAVFAPLSGTGGIKTGAAGSTVDGYIETAWKVRDIPRDAEPGLVIITVPFTVPAPATAGGEE
jgi:hypothetical protein